MRSDFVVIRGVVLQDVVQVRFAEHHEVVERFAPDRSDKSLNMPLLPRRPRRDRVISNPHCANEAVRRAAHDGRKRQGTELYFENVDELRRVLTENRMELLLAIGHDRPASIQELAGLVGRDYKNVSTDIALLERLGLVSLTARGGRGKPQR